jgi:oxygen-independent coproporphyrinogen-3 oxidase
MAGIYIHIPFCRQKCYYCDFYKTVNTSILQQFILAVKTEAKLRKNYLDKASIETIYFGGGTPTVLLPSQISEILQTIYSEYKVNKNVEVTLEANPDDLTQHYLKECKQAGINRLSIGIQALQNVHLKKMNRRHTANEALKSIEIAANQGYNNISVDLIYGLPGLTLQEWKQSLRELLGLSVQHLSSYHLTYHKGTPFYTWLKKGTLKETSEKNSVEQFSLLNAIAREHGFEQYEISNYARTGMYSQHNTAYWLGKSYLGLGPSAHSYNTLSRRWNVADTKAYIDGIEQNSHDFYQEEILSDNDKYNEYILTRIRTKWGVSLRDIEHNFGTGKHSYFLQQLQKYNHSGALIICDKTVCLSEKGMFISDEIMTDLMII